MLAILLPAGGTPAALLMLAIAIPLLIPLILKYKETLCALLGKAAPFELQCFVGGIGTAFAFWSICGYKLLEPLISIILSTLGIVGADIIGDNGFSTCLGMGMLD